MIRTTVAAALAVALAPVALAPVALAPEALARNALAQDAAPSAATAEWQVYSRSDRTAYLADPASIAMAGDVTSIRTARAPLAPQAGDPAWTIETFEIRCAADQYRIVSTGDFNADGSEATPVEPTGEAFEAVSPNGRSGFLKQIACEDQRARPPYYASVADWIRAGRK